MTDDSKARYAVVTEADGCGDLPGLAAALTAAGFVGEYRADEQAPDRRTPFVFTDTRLADEAFAELSKILLDAGVRHLVTVDRNGRVVADYELVPRLTSGPTAQA